VTRAGLSRRGLLRAFAGPGAASFLLPWLRPRAARAAPGASSLAARNGAAGAVTRLLIYWQGSGVPRHAYQFRSASGGPPTETDFVFPEVRTPLEAVKQDLIALGNMDMVSATVDALTAANAHQNGETHSLAATNRANRDTAGGPSFDQFIAKALNRARPVTRFPSLALAAQCDGNVGPLRVCTSGPGQVIALDPSPASAYKRLVSGLAPPPAGAAIGDDRSVLDLVLGDFGPMRAGLSRAERDKLDAHMQAVRDLESRLSLGPGPGTVGPPACQDPTRLLLAGTGNRHPATPDMDHANFAAMSRLVQVAFACDLTRVVLLAAPEPADGAWGYTPGQWGTDGVHDLIHKTSYNAAGILKGNRDAMKAVTALHQLEARRFVALLDLLRAVPDLDGRSLLDHTIVLWCSQIAEHGHDVDQLPWVLAGGAAAGFRTGRLVRPQRRGGKGVPHNDLFVTIANAMGVAVTRFGNPAVCTGPMPGLRAG
jgi:hypothetical protein